MKRIYKFTLTPDKEPTVLLPRGTRILSAGFQGENLRIWAEVNIDEDDKSWVQFLVLPTGDEGTNWVFLNTVFHPAGLVFHVFYDAKSLLI